MAGFKLLGSSAEMPPQIDRYELVAEIASGGMATVYLARLQGVGGFQRFFAIKRMHPHLGNEESFVQMFLDEARLVANIRHPNVVPVLEVGAGDSGYYLVMEYIEGDTFSTFLAKAVRENTRIPPGVSVKIVLDMLAGLHAAHELRDPDGNALGLVHRDVSPQNVLLDLDGVARISDFGVAHATTRLSSTRAGQLKGKVAYMAPEQARGGQVTRSADVFAAGIVLWEALCRKRLFMGENEAVTLNRLMFEPIPKLRQGNPVMPGTLEKVLDRALDREANARFASAAEFAEAIESAARGARMLATNHEVKAYVDAAIGPVMANRRNTVRDHLAMIDRAKQEISRPAAGPRPPASEPNAETVSTVSAAAVALPSDASSPGGTSSVGELSDAPRHESAGNRRKVVALALGGTALLVGAGALLFARPAGVSDSSQPSADADVGASPSVASAQPSAPPIASPSQSETAASAAPTQSAEPAPTTTTTRRDAPKGTVRTGQGAAPPATTPAATAETTATGKGNAPPSATDDLKKNPYR